MRVAADCGRVQDRPLGGFVAIVGRGREFVFGREAVIDRDGEAAGSVRQGLAGRVMAVEIAHDPAPAVKEDQHRMGAVARGSVDAQRQVAGQRRNAAVLD